MHLPNIHNIYLRRPWWEQTEYMRRKTLFKKYEEHVHRLHKKGKKIKRKQKHEWFRSEVRTNMEKQLWERACFFLTRLTFCPMKSRVLLRMSGFRSTRPLTHPLPTSVLEWFYINASPHSSSSLINAWGVIDQSVPSLILYPHQCVRHYRSMCSLTHPLSPSMHELF